MKLLFDVLLYAHPPHALDVARARAEAGAIEQANRVDRPRKPVQVLEAAEVADVVDERAVAVGAAG